MDHLQNTKKKYKNFKVTGDSQYIYQNKIYKACFQQYMAYGDFKYLTKGTTSDKILHDTAFNIGKNPKYDGYQMGLASTVYKRFDKKLLAAVLKIKLFLIKNQQKNCTNQLLENSRKEKYTHLL